MGRLRPAQTYSSPFRAIVSVTPILDSKPSECRPRIAPHGQVTTGSFVDYAMPRAGDVGNFVHEFDQSMPCRNNPLGAKGVGELGTIGATPAVANAVVDALVRAGKADRAYQIQMPLTAEKLWRVLADQ